MKAAFSFVFENILLWFVTPTLVFLLLVKPLVLLRGYLLILLATLFARFLAWRRPSVGSLIVCAFPPFFSKRLRRDIWSETDTSFMFRRGSVKFIFVICEELHNEEESKWVVEAFKRQMQNYLFLHHKPWLTRVFDWFGFTGAFRQGFGQFAVAAIRRGSGGFTTESFIVSPKRVIGSSFSERMPTPIREPGLPFSRKIEIARSEMEKVKASITKRCGREKCDNHPTLLLEEARIAGSLADSEGEAVRLLKAIGSDDRTVSEFTEQLTICISRVYK